MTDTFRFSADDPAQNREQIDLILEELQSEFPGLSINVSHEIQGNVVVLRYSLSAMLREESDDEHPAYQLKDMRHDTGISLSESAVLSEPRKVLQDYDRGVDDRHI